VSRANRLECDVPTDWANDFSQCLFEWQGLEGGILALLAAVIGAILLWRQINQSNLHRKDDWDRKHTAAKLTMPLALSGVSEAVQKMADEIAGQLETFQPEGFERTLDSILDGGVERKRFDAIVIPADVVGTFERFVETLTNPVDIKHVSELVANLQILFSRFNDLDLQGAGARTSLESLLLDAAKVKVLNDGMFNYARNIVEASFGLVGAMSNKDAWLKIKSAAQSLVFSRPIPDFFFPAINQTIDHYIKEDTSPWLEKFPT
jgi:hypothetical protein